MRRLRKRRLAAKLCVDCGEIAVSKWYCVKCRAKHSESARNYKDKKRQANKGFLQRLLGI